ncbi:GGDEF domain-containing protein [Fredinandcohnia humi]
MDNTEIKQLQRQVTLLRAEGKYKETIEAGHDLLERGLEINDYKSILTAHINMAASFYCIGDIEEAFTRIEAYDAICSTYGDDADWVNLYNVLFLLYEFKKDFQKAKETLEKSIELAKKIEKYNIVSNGYSNLSHLCIVEENFVNALNYAKLGLEMAKLHKPESPILELRVKLNLTKAYIGLDEIDASKLLINEISNEPFLDSLPREKAQFYDLQGAWYSKQKLYPEAFESFTIAKQIAEGFNDVYLLKTIQEERCKLCDVMNDVNLGYIVQKEYISLLKEISERELAFAALKLDIKHSISTMEKKANTDYLTGIYNRKYLEKTVNSWLEQNDAMVCMAIDIDDFKFYNDEFGHLFGDEVIKQVSNTLSRVLNENEIIGRYGGDEFVVVVKGATIDEGEKKAQQFEKVVSSLEIKKDDISVSVKISIGVADNSSGTITSFEQLFHVADTALYQAKKSRKNKFL